MSYFSLPTVLYLSNKLLNAEQRAEWILFFFIKSSIFKWTTFSGNLQTAFVCFCRHLHATPHRLTTNMNMKCWTKEYCLTLRICFGRVNHRNIGYRNVTHFLLTSFVSVKWCELWHVLRSHIVYRHTGRQPSRTLARARAVQSVRLFANAILVCRRNKIV